MNALTVNSGKKFIKIIGNYMWSPLFSSMEWTASRQKVEMYKTKSKGVLHLTYFDLHSSLSGFLLDVAYLCWSAVVCLCVRECLCVQLSHLAALFAVLESLSAWLTL